MLLSWPVAMATAAGDESLQQACCYGQPAGAAAAAGSRLSQQGDSVTSAWSCDPDRCHGNEQETKKPAEDSFF